MPRETPPDPATVTGERPEISSGMPGHADSGDGPPGGSGDARKRREARLRAALRENLRRRKAPGG